MARSASLSNLLLAVDLCVMTILLNACRGAGGSGAAAVSPRFAYVANSGDDTISIYTVDAATGQLHANGYMTAERLP